MTEPKSCGNCRWWVEIKDRINRIGHCTAPLPDALGKAGRMAMLSIRGTDCPCHEMKGSGDE